MNIISFLEKFGDVLFLFKTYANPAYLWLIGVRPNFV